MATVEITKDNIDQVINDNDIVFLDFWADWCGPCKQFGPVFEAASEKHEDIVFGKVDTEAQQELAAGFQVTSIPMLVVFREKVGIFGQPGALPAPALEELIGQVREVDMTEVHKQVAEMQAKEASGEDPQA